VEAERSGRPRKTIPEDDDKIFNSAKSYQKEGSPKVQKVMQDENIQISISTITRRLNEQGARYKHPSYAPKLTNTNIKKRLQWALKNRTHHWKRIIFSDEKVFYFGKETGRVWCIPGADNSRKTTKARFKIHVSGGMSYQALTELKEIDGNVNTHNFQKILTEKFLPKWHQWNYEGDHWFP
jgi:hypothetical protein